MLCTGLREDNLSIRKSSSDEHLLDALPQVPGIDVAGFDFFKHDGECFEVASALNFATKHPDGSKSFRASLRQQ